MSRPGGKEALSSILGGRALDVAGRGGSWRGVVGSSRGVSQEEEEGSQEEGREITTSFRESLMGDTYMVTGQWEQYKLHCINKRSYRGSSRS